MISLPRSSVEDSKEHKSCNMTPWRAVSFSCLGNSRKTAKTDGCQVAEPPVRTSRRHIFTGGSDPQTPMRSADPMFSRTDRVGSAGGAGMKEEVAGAVGGRL